MRSLALDIETYCELPITKTGVYPYAAHNSFEILLLSYAIDDGPVQVVDLALGEQLPQQVVAAIQDSRTIKYAFNAQFERVCLSAWLGAYLDPASWRCSMVWASSLGLPMGLESAGKALNISQQKLDSGKALIRYFCQPCRPTKANNGRRRNLPQHDPDKWEEFKAYNSRDVEAEQEIRAKLELFPMPEQEWRYYASDQRINDRGIGVDTSLAAEAIAIDENYRRKALARSTEITQLENPNSVTQLRQWLEEQGAPLPNLAKATVREALETATGPVREVLELRQRLSKSSTRKYQAVIDTAGADSRSRGLLQFAGASRTGRWAGRLIQVQNLPRNEISDLDQARALVAQGNQEAIELLYDNLPALLSQLIRTAFIPEDGSRFIVADYSAIEARVIAWLSGEQWRLDLFRDGGDIYCQSASKMFGVPVEKHGVNSHLRQKGKVAELACGYGGSVGALTAMGALEMGVEEAELQNIVDAWRAASPHLVDYWWQVDRATKQSVSSGTRVELGHGIATSYERGILFISLPSGRRLAYPGAQLRPGKFRDFQVHYRGVNAANRWTWIESYGPKFVENIVQATARDLLAYAIQTIENAGHKVVMHVHDEVVVEEPLTGASVELIVELMTKAPTWAAGLPLDADGYACSYYQKD